MNRRLKQQLKTWRVWSNPSKRQSRRSVLLIATNRIGAATTRDMRRLRASIGISEAFQSLKAGIGEEGLSQLKRSRRFSATSMDSELHGFAAVQVSHKREQGTKGDEGLHIVYSLVNLILSLIRWSVVKTNSGLGSARRASA